MANAKLVIPGQLGPLALFPNGVIASPQFVGGSFSQGFRTQFWGDENTPVAGATINPYSVAHASAGYNVQLVSPSAGGAGITNLEALAIPNWVAGQSYVQWAVVFDPLGLGTKAYVKFTAGTLAPNTTAPSSDAVNWRLIETPGTSAPSLITGNYVTRGIWNSQTIRGDQPASVELLRDGTGGTATAVLTGRSADGTTIPDGKLRVEGEVNCEFVRITNTIHAANPTIGSGQLGAGGTLTINTTASDPTAKIFITPTSAITGFLYVTNVGAASFDVVSSAAGGDANKSFNWVIFNPTF